MLMAGSSARLGTRGDRISRSIATALRRGAVGRVRPEERAWIDRIEAERTSEDSGALRWISMPPVLSRLLLHLVRELRPRECLELGTGYGISTAYQAAALELDSRGHLVSLDVPEMSELAARGLARLGLDSRVELVPGLLADTLDAVAGRSPGFDYALLDADHTEKSTVGAFDTILPAMADPGVVVVDDINWNPEMHRAWRTIAGCGPVVGTVSIRRLGIAIVSASSR
jgi:predicted O-methyltransferase YrrM